MRSPKLLFPLFLLLVVSVVFWAFPFRAADETRRQDPSGPAAGTASAVAAPQASGVRSPGLAQSGAVVAGDPVPEFPTATVLDESIDPLPGGAFVRRRLLAVEDHYSRVRVVERYGRQADGQIRRDTIEAMLADSVLVVRPEGTSPEQFAATLERLGLRADRQYLFSPAVRAFVPDPVALDTILVVLARLETEAPALAATPDFLHFPQALPNDYDGRLLWGLEKIQAPVAWTATTGSQTLVAAIIDSGIDLQHPDLQTNLWLNPGETRNGLDDDGNGLVDDLNGWDFASNDNSPADQQGHGTHVAGIIGAVGNNGTGVTGVAARVKLLALRCGDTTLTTSAMIQALDYVTALKQRGVPIVAVNNSYTSGSSLSTQKDSIVRAKQAGLLFVAAAGNDGRDIDQGMRAYPICYPVDNIVGVAASNLGDQLADYSNWGGSSVLLAAPGSAILSTVPGAGYGVKDGTSMAAPMVVGAAVLLKAAHPELDYTGLKQRLATAVVPIPALQGKVLSGGRLDLRRLLVPTVALPHVEWVAPLADVAALEQNDRPLTLAVHAFQEVDGTETGLLPVVWEKVFGAGNVNFEAGSQAGQTVARFSAAGLYRIRATAVLGSSSATAEKTVAVGSAPIEVEAGSLLARWTFDESSGPVLDRSGNERTATLIGTPTRDVGPLGNAALRFDGATTAASFAAPAPAKVTVAGWMYMDGLGNSIFPRLVHTPSYYLFPARDATIDANKGTVKFLAHWDAGDGVYFSPPGLVANSRWYHLAATYDSTGGVHRLPELYLDGRALPVAAQTLPAGNFAATAGTGYLGNNAEQTRALLGLLADVRIYGRELHPAEISLLSAESALGSLLAWQLVVVSNTDTTAEVQLRKADGRIPNATQGVVWKRIEGPGAATFGTLSGGQASLTVPTVGNYTITVGLTEGTVEMERRFIVLLPGVPALPVAPRILRQPVGRTVAVGSTLVLEVEAAGSPPLRYQWFLDGEPIAGGTSAALTIPNIQKVAAGRYSVRVTNGGGSATSADTMVVVLDPPSIVVQPRSQSVAAGSRVELKIEATGSSPLSYQWRRNEAPLDGATSATLVIDKFAIEQNGSYSVRVSNSVGSVESESAVIEALLPPIIIGQSQSQSVPVSSSVTFSVTAQGAFPLLYQWFKDGTAISGETTSTLWLASLQPSGAGTYRVRVSNSVGEVFSDPIELEVLEAPRIVEQPRAQAAAKDSAVTLRVVAAGSAPLSYQWYLNSNVLVGRTGAVLTIDRLQPTDTGGYQVMVTNKAGKTTSDLVYVEIVAPPSLLSGPSGGAVMPGGSLQLDVLPSGLLSSYTFRWLHDGSAVPGATTQRLLLDNIQPEQAGLYVAEVSSAGGTTLSLPAVVGVIPTARTAGAVETRAEWQDIHHPNGNVYDQFLLNGVAGTITADPGQIARISFLDTESDIVQVELSGAGAATVRLTSASGPHAPVLYNQTGIGYYQGIATVVVVGADATTHLSIYSVGRLNNPGVARADVPYDGWADVRALGLVSAGGSLGGLHLGNVTFSATAGPTGVVAPSVRSLGTIIVHEVVAAEGGWPLLAFSPQGRIALKIAGGNLAQANGRSIEVSGLASVALGAGMGSSGQEAPAQIIRGRLTSEGVDVTAALTTSPPP